MTSYNHVLVAGRSLKFTWAVLRGLVACLSIAERSRVPLPLTIQTLRGIMTWIVRSRVGMLTLFFYGYVTPSTRQWSTQGLGDGQMGKIPEPVRVTTEQITPEISEKVSTIIDFLMQEVDGPPMALSILTIAMIVLHNKYGHVSQEEFAEKMKINLMNTKVGVAQEEIN